MSARYVKHVRTHNVSTFRIEIVDKKSVIGQVPF